jgi:hypothetical protein
LRSREAVAISVENGAALATNIAVGNDSVAARVIDFKPVPVRAGGITVTDSLLGSLDSNLTKVSVIVYTYKVEP